MYFIKWQKKLLPHAHTLIWLIEKITLDQIDQIFLAEIIYVNIDPDLFEVTTKNMIHCPCGLHN